MEIFEILLTANFWEAAIRIASPLIFGVLGALICERAGVLYLGIEGIFTAGAMAGWMAERLHDIRGSAGRALVLGLTFKENVPDLRNSKVADLIAGLADRGHEVTVHDPLADAEEARHEYGLTLDADALDWRYDLVVLAVPHGEYLELGHEKLRGLVADGGMLADLKGALGGAADWTL